MNLREALTDIYVRHSALTPKIVVEEARPPESPLHSRFEWDDTIAGEKFRQVQAAELIRSLKVVSGRDEEGNKTVREWLSVERPDRPRSYEPLGEVLADPFTFQMVLQEMERDMASLQRRYGSLKEFRDALREALENTA